MHWAADYIGLPWIAGTRDCWAFFRTIQSDHYGREVPAVDVASYSARDVVRLIAGHPERLRWRLVTEPNDGDAVLMARNEHPAHVGIWVAELGRVLHCAEGFGVLCQNVSSLRINGWANLRYYTPCA
jgi:hypothetical protein